MTNRPGRPRQTKPAGRRVGWASSGWLLVLGVWLGSLLNVALNTATDPTTRYPGPLRLLQQYPWQAAALLTLILAVLAWQQRPRTASQPQDADLLPRVLTVRHQAAPTATELAVLHRELLQQVRRTWIEDVLERSLAQVARVELGLAERPGAITHPWGALLHQPGQPEQALPPGARIATFAGRFDRQLLILGGPGAGKTTLLLEYAADLLQQAEQDGAAPMPVVFHLSAWPAEQPSLARWLVEELAVRYGVTRRLGVELVAHDRLAVLLDGLDEVPADRRAACIGAINAFRGEHGGVPLVVCARSRDYQELAAQLVLKGAVEVQPLDRGRVSGWLSAAGRPLAGLRAALRDQDHWLWGLLDSPLLLSIAALTYKDQPASVFRSHGSVESLLGAYVAAMLARPRAPLAGPHDELAYADVDTLRWLAWLAERMGPGSVFYPDWIQPDWLPTRRQLWLATTGLGLAAALAVGLAGGLVAGLTFGPGIGLFYGLTGGSLVAGYMGLTGQSARIEPIEPIRWSWGTARYQLNSRLAVRLAVGVLIGGLAGLTGWLAGGLIFGLLAGLLLALGVGAGFVLGRGFESRSNVRPAAPLEGIRAAARVGRRSGLVTGLAVLVGGLAYGLAQGLAGLRVGLMVGLFGGPVAGLVIGLDQGGASYLRHRLLVVLLQGQGLIPVDLLGFLDYADGRILLRRAGGGYLFIHRLLDYLANRGHQTDPAHATGEQQAVRVQ
jgi:hypothetical protein